MEPLGQQSTFVLIWSMMLNLQRALFLAAMILAAAFVAPISAQAHDGHVHAARAASKLNPHPPHDAALRHQAASKLSIVSVTDAGPFGPTAPVTRGCADHCCGGAGGMACCGAALAPDTCFFPLFHVSALFVICDVPPLPGLPPEALPKPPKSFA
jgi:hypothetical protein